MPAVDAGYSTLKFTRSVGWVFDSGKDLRRLRNQFDDTLSRFLHEAMDVIRHCGFITANDFPGQRSDRTTQHVGMRSLSDVERGTELHAERIQFGFSQRDPSRSSFPDLAHSIMSWEIQESLNRTLAASVDACSYPFIFRKKMRTRTGPGRPSENLGLTVRRFDYPPWPRSAKTAKTEFFLFLSAGFP